MVYIGTIEKVRELASSPPPPPPPPLQANALVNSLIELGTLNSLGMVVIDEVYI